MPKPLTDLETTELRKLLAQINKNYPSVAAFLDAVRKAERAAERLEAERG